MYKCDYCNYISNRKYNVTLHSNIKHLNKINLTNTDNTDNTNDDNIIDNSIKCIRCTKQFSSKSNLIRHSHICKGIVNRLECNKCNKKFSCSSSRCRHTKTCKIKEPDDNSPIINNTTNNIINTNNTNNNTNNNNNNTINNTNNIVNNTYIFQSDPNIHPLASQNYNMQQLSNNVIIPNRNNLQLMMENFGRLIYNDVKNKNIKKGSTKTKFCLVKNEKGEWVNKLDKDIIPKATKDIAYNFRIIIDDNEIELCNINKKNKSILPKLTEFLSIIIDYNHELEISNDTDKEDNKLFNDMKDRTICIIIDSSNYK